LNIIGEIVAGSDANFTLAHPPVINTLALYGSGVRLTGGGVDYTQSGATLSLITFTSPETFAAGTVTADYDTNDNPSYGTQVGTDILNPSALTTLQRVKDLLFDPNSVILLTGATLSNGSEAVSAYTVATGKTIRAGQQISGLGIPAGTTIASVNGATLMLSQNAVQDSTGSTLTVIDQTPQYDGMLIRMINSVSRYIANECGRTSFVQQTYVNDTYSTTSSNQDTLILRNTPVFSLTSLQYRAGTPTNPSWTDYIPDQYELINPRTDPVSGLIWYPSGMVRIYGSLPTFYSNQIRATYVAGYPVNWANAEDGVTHLLPADLTNLCENLVVRRFKRRNLAGQSTMTIEGATVGGWRDKLDQEDLDTINQYKDMHF
jgi:hypothetical protein